MPDDRMPDDRMDDRLRRAGQAWRAGETGSAAAAATDEVDELLMPAPSRRSRTHRAVALASAAVVAAGLVAGGVFVRDLVHDGSDDVAPVALQGTVWQLRGYGSQDDANSSATFYIDGSGHLVADDTCEVIGGSAAIGSSTLQIAKQIVRYRSCTDSTGEMTFTRGLALLRGRSAYSLDDERLTISRAGAKPMHFAAAPGTPAPTLDVPTFVGANWRLVSIKDSSGTTAVTKDIGFHLADDGRYTASDGCNALSGSVQLNGPAVDLGTPGTTYALCTKGASRAIDPILRGRVTQLIDGATMTLTKQGVGTLTFRWVPQRSPATTPASLFGTDWQLSQVTGDASTVAASLRIGKAGGLTGSDGCRQLHAHADVRAGTMTITGVPLTGLTGCTEQAATVDSLLQGTVLWSVRDGKLVIDGGGAQAFALVYVQPGTGSSTTDPRALDGTTWQLTGTAKGAGPVLPVPSTVQLRLGFVNNGKINYDTPASFAEASVTIGAGTLKIGKDVTGGASGCALSPVCNLGFVISAVLSGSPQWSIDGDTLTITEPGAGTLVYTSTTTSTATSPAPPSSTNTASPSGLQGPNWRLVGIAHGPTSNVPGQSAQTELTLRFTSREVVQTTECGSRTRRLHVDGTSLEFGATIHVDDHSCPYPGAVAEQQQTLVDNVLKSTVRWEIVGRQLTLTKGATSLVFSS